MKKFVLVLAAFVAMSVASAKKHDVSKELNERVYSETSRLLEFCHPVDDAELMECLSGNLYIWSFVRLSAICKLCKGKDYEVALENAASILRDIDLLIDEATRLKEDSK